MFPKIAQLPVLLHAALNGRVQGGAAAPRPRAFDEFTSAVTSRLAEGTPIGSDSERSEGRRMRGRTDRGDNELNVQLRSPNTHTDTHPQPFLWGYLKYT